ncbi:hypothetical protein XTGART2_2103 [Xanthomonas translucens pv. graminis]|jgi:hypothetical protein|uniref:Uncharacterized protein n=1 Tax=Xanthomonas graminis pv. graminis TaxID=134874 RepID=A0A1M4IL70_9XANT|nr:putative peptide [Xanthomonas translucens pv. graminis ART-Xtg29]SBV42294.1 hypothetical protein XTGART2_2103 [Xanthomonas translucens pv. graminis]SBV42979.1 hypothetical protein XTGART9_2104 [Xanthomonas translucens pv. graminis]SBV55472.1 hypothetical protein XTGART10_2110 [Xanthomonas translucens pv. graminis]SBV58915.1 hypothetical protein XTGICMP6431_2093 [Xanthomonas translucens pv. graminis]
MAALPLSTSLRALRYTRRRLPRRSGADRIAQAMTR